MSADLPDPERPVPGLPGIPEDPPDPPKTVELVGKVKEGDARALNELFRRYQPRLRRVVRIKMGPRLRACCDADDIVQESCMVALAKLGEFEMRGQASVLQWLTKIAEYQIRNKLDHLNAQRRDPARERRLRAGDSSSTEISRGEVVASQGPTPSQIHIRAELEGILDECVEEIEPEDYREVILMRDYYGADWEAIRVQLGRPTLDAARELHRRAHEKLREKLRARGVSS